MTKHATTALVGLLAALSLAMPCTRARGQSALSLVPPRSLGLAGSDIADSRDPRSTNPAADLDSSSLLHAAFSPMPTGIEGSWSGVAGAAWLVDPADQLTATLGRYQYQDIYSETGIATQYVHAFKVAGDGTDQGPARVATGGIRIRYAQERFGGPYLPLTDISVDAGLQFELTREITLGAAVTHITSVYQDQDLPSAQRTEFFGISYRPRAAEIAVDIAVESEADIATSTHVGFEYQFDDYVAFRAGYETVTDRFSVGLGIRYAPLVMDFAFTHDAALGSLLAFGMSYIM